MEDNQWSANESTVNGLIEFAECSREFAVGALVYCYHHPGAHPVAVVEALKKQIADQGEFDRYVEKASQAAWLLEVRIG